MKIRKDTRNAGNVETRKQDKRNTGNVETRRQDKSTKRKVEKGDEEGKKEKYFLTVPASDDVVVWKHAVLAVEPFVALQLHGEDGLFVCVQDDAVALADGVPRAVEHAEPLLARGTCGLFGRHRWLDGQIRFAPKYFRLRRLSSLLRTMDGAEARDESKYKALTAALQTAAFIRIIC